MVATHLNQVLYKHAHELIGHEEVQQLLQVLAKSSPKLAEELVPGMVSLSTLLKVLQALLQEQVSVRDIRSIAEAIAQCAGQESRSGALVAVVRVALSRAIVQGIVGLEPELPVITLDPRLEQILLGSVQKAGQGADEGFLLEPGMAEKLQRSLVETAQRQEASASRWYCWLPGRSAPCSPALHVWLYPACMCCPTRKCRTTSRSPSSPP